MINPRQAKILIVDDEREIRDLLCSRFGIFGFQTYGAASGDEAWEIIQQDPLVKIVVTDMRMSNGDGPSLIERCKAKDPEFPRIFVITGYAQSSCEQALAMGAEGQLTKPFDSRTLLNTVRTSLLSVQERLRYPPYITPTDTLKGQITDLAEAHEAKKFELGRGGFYIHTDHKIPAEGGLIALDYKAGPVHLEGTGIVRWRRAPTDAKSVTAGIEFVHLTKESVAGFAQWLAQNNVSTFIPSPQRTTSMPSKAKLQSTG